MGSTPFWSILITIERIQLNQICSPIYRKLAMQTFAPRHQFVIPVGMSVSVIVSDVYIRPISDDIVFVAWEGCFSI